MSKINELFTEKFRPKSISQLIATERVKSELNQGLYQNLLFFGQAGTGKTSGLFILAENHPKLYINASLERGIDTVREKISKFCSTISLEGGKENLKCVILDECLEENEEIRIGSVNDFSNVKLKDLELNKIYYCVSLNMNTLELENDTCEIILDKEDEVYEIELENGKKILVTANHPFVLINKENNNVFLKSINDGLNEMDELIIF